MEVAYVVTEDMDGMIMGVFSTQEKAQAWIDSQPKRKVRFKPYEVSNYSSEPYTIDEALY